MQATKSANPRRIPAFKGPTRSSEGGSRTSQNVVSDEPHLEEISVLSVVDFIINLAAVSHRQWKVLIRIGCLPRRVLIRKRLLPSRGLREAPRGVSEVIRVF